MQKQLNLPRIYKSTSEKFSKHNGKAKISYSQFSSWNDPMYKYSYILGYIFNIPQADNFWAGFGSYCGTLLEYRMCPENAKGIDKELLDEAVTYLTEDDMNTLHKADKMIPSNTVYEREIVLDRGHYVVQGFIDVNYLTDDNSSVVIDFKTGGKNSKTKGVSFYKSDKYGQTRLYARALKEEGEKLGYCGVVMLDRTYQTEKTHPGTTSCFENPILHLSGDIVEIETPYTEEKVEILLDKMDKTAKEISLLKTTYDKLSTLEMEL